MSSLPAPEPTPVYQPYRPTPSSSTLTLQQRQALYTQQLQQQQLQQQQLALQHAQHPNAGAITASTTSALAKKKLKTAALAFGMGALVGGTVIGLHSVLNRIPVQQALRSAAGTGSAFGVIFAVGSVIRE